MIKADVARPHCSAAIAPLTIPPAAVDENLSAAIKVSLNVYATYENGVKLITFFQRLFHATRSICGVFESASGVLEPIGVLLAAAEPDVWTRSLKGSVPVTGVVGSGERLALDHAEGLDRRVNTSETAARHFFRRR
jgi:hypothetical protein